MKTDFLRQVIKAFRLEISALKQKYQGRLLHLKQA
jgi:hypothetical protein